MSRAGYKPQLVVRLEFIQKRWVSTSWAWGYVHVHLVGLDPLLALGLVLVTLVRGNSQQDVPKIFLAEPRGKSAPSFPSHIFVPLSVLFGEHESLETLQPMVRLLAVAVIEEDLLFVFKAFEVVTSRFFFLSFFFACLMVFSLLTGQGLILCFPFSFLFFDLFEAASCLKDVSLLIYHIVPLFIPTSFLLTYSTSMFDVCFLDASSHFCYSLNYSFYVFKCKSGAFILNLFSDLQLC